MVSIACQCRRGNGALECTALNIGYNMSNTDQWQEPLEYIKTRSRYRNHHTRKVLMNRTEVSWVLLTVSGVKVVSVTVNSRYWSQFVMTIRLLLDLTSTCFSECTLIGATPVPGITITRQAFSAGMHDISPDMI